MLVLGAGLAATALVAALRSGGFAGEITVAGDEDPYDRPPLTTELFTRSAPEDLREQFSLTGDAAAWIRARATGIEGGVVTLRDGAGRAMTATAGAVVLALGSRPIVPVGWEGVRTLSRWDDAVALRTALAPGAHLVIAGAGWIGLELASSAAAEGATVTVIEDTGRPLGRLLPEPVAERVTAWLRAVTPGTVTLVEGRVATASPTMRRYMSKPTPSMWPDWSSPRRLPAPRSSRSRMAMAMPAPRSVLAAIVARRSCEVSVSVLSGG